MYVPKCSHLCVDRAAISVCKLNLEFNLTVLNEANHPENVDWVNPA